MMLFQRFVFSFLLTILAELPFFFLFCKNRSVGLSVFLLANLLTNPPAVLLSLLLRCGYPAVPAILLQLPIELSVIALEALIFRFFRESFPKPFCLSLSANCFSYILGLLL